MFAVVRTGGKQYRVAAGDKIVVEKIAGDAGDRVELGDVLVAGDGGELKDTGGLVVAAEIIAQAKGEKVIVFKKRRRHNYRRRNGHRQQHTILRILSLGGESSRDEGSSKTAAPTDATPVDTTPAGGEAVKAAPKKNAATRAAPAPDAQPTE